jgi:hypothetical protein
MRTDISKKTGRPYGKFYLPGWNQDDCERYAPDIAARAKRSLDEMSELERQGKEQPKRQGRSALPRTA